MNAIGRIFRLLRGAQAGKRSPIASYRDFARRIAQVDHAHLFKIERGEKLPSVELIERVGLALLLPARQLAILRLCQRSEIEPGFIDVVWDDERYSADALAIANILVKTFGCFDVALEQAVAAITKDPQALERIGAKVPPHFEGTKPR